MVLLKFSNEKDYSVGKKAIKLSFFIFKIVCVI
ncbi:hypothetical protein BCD_0866 (plasmid) [Borrelia crocidurae DOU]|uniref:Uncharacterized protein n=1 Tax=Borrelia crocidurae DOU TaxID=1293575 RepID=W5SJ33_9SPIR|nr:hypothetical protein BCD_0866 [Borrelia crocidurae DOU]